jgi:hypothetical protein
MNKIEPNEVLPVISAMQNKGIKHPSLNAMSMWGWLDRLNGLGVIFKNAYIPDSLLPQDDLGNKLDLVLWDRSLASSNIKANFDPWALFNLGRFTISLNPATLKVIKEHITARQLLESWEENIDFIRLDL